MTTDGTSWSLLSVSHRMVEIVVVPIDSGVDRVTWRTSGGQPDNFLLADARVASPRWLTLADAVVQPSQPILAEAQVSGRATWDSLPGCTVVAIGVTGHGCLLLGHTGAQLFLPSADGSAAESRRWAALGYLALAHAGSFGTLTKHGLTVSPATSDHGRDRPAWP